MAKFTIKVTATLNGKTCKNPQIEFIQGEDFLYPCEIKDGEITFEIKPGTNPNACVEGYIKCEDECLNCPPQYFKKCLCNDVTLLEACQKCVDGFIVDTCTPAQLAMGMICTPDGCQCPPSSPIKDPNTGQCVQCITGTVSSCKICVAGHWEDIVCPTGERCDNGICKCPPGYIRDPFTGLCIVTPSCDEDSDCGLCEICVSGNCVPLVCPEGYKCVDGECVYWPCTNTNCTNGADCGEGCGCLNGVCTPCYLLDCVNATGLSIYPACTGALGCKCSGTACVPVDNCDQYCDSFTPCTEPGCTCYNNRCVSCANFPCLTTEGGCDSYYNCECVNGNCEGTTCVNGDCEGCKDRLELLKKETCLGDGCELSAELTTTNTCKCDPIEFRVKNLKTCAAQELENETTNNPESSGPVVYLNFNVEMFKNNVSFTKWKDVVQFGDDEFVEATISTVIQHYTKNASGAWEKVNSVSGISNVPDTFSFNNAIPNITINSTHLRESIGGKKTKVEIELIAKSVKIPNNGCTGYGTEQIAIYEIDFSTPTLACSAIEAAKAIKIKALGSNTSKTPLFVWFKSSNGSYANTKFLNNGVYAQSGWFRKEYGVKQSGKWIDKINNPNENLKTSQSGDQPKELWNNFSYRVQVDCGCAASASQERVIFCCPKDIPYVIEECGRKIVVAPFGTCSVNKKLPDHTGSYKIPIEAQTYYWVVINGNTELELNSNGGPVINTPFTYTHTAPITSIKFEQRYKGSPLVPVACSKEFTEDPDVPDFDITSSCGVITVTKRPDTPAIATVTSTTPGVIFVPSVNNTVWTSTSQPLFVNGVHSVKASFTGSCMLSKDVTISCGTAIEAIPTKVRAEGQCPNGTNPNIKVRATEGFSNAVKFSRDGITYVNPDPLVAPETKPSKTFNDFTAGVYTLYAKETINGTEVIATTSVEILAMLQPIAAFDPATTCGVTGSNFKITGGATGSQWRVVGPQYPGPNGTLITLGQDGTATVPVNASFAGAYSAEILADTSNSTCIPKIITATLGTAGGNVSPTIAFQASAVCLGQPVGFAIRSGQGLTFNISALNGTIKDSNGIVITNLVSIESGFNGTFTPTSTSSSSLSINSIANNTGNCFVLVVPPAATLTVNNGPVLGSVGAFCSSNQVGQYDAFVQITGTATGVILAGGSATEEIPGSNVWWRRNVTYTPFVDTITTYVVQSAACSIQGDITLPTCTTEEVCPPQPGNVVISSNSPTCGPGEVTVNFVSSGLGSLVGAQYEWISLLGSPGSYSEVILESGFIVNPSTLSLSITTTNNSYSRITLRITLNGACVYDSNIVDVLAITTPEPSITGQTTGVTTTGSYVYQVAPVVNGTYVWTLTNSAGTNPIGVTTSNQVTISNFLAGLNTINVTVTNGDGCTGLDSLAISVDLACPEVVTIQTVTGSAAANCKNLTGVVQFIPPGVTITSHEWYFGGTVLTQSGVGGTITPLDTSVIAPGDTESVTLRVYFSDSCIVTSAAYSYTRATAVNTVSKVLKAPGGAAMNFATTNYWITTARGRACASQGGAGWTLYLDPTSQAGQSNFQLPTVNTDCYLIGGPSACVGFKSMTDFVSELNTQLLPFNATVSYNAGTNTLTYSTSVNTNVREQLSIYTVSAAVCSGGPNSGEYSNQDVADIRLDFPCQCP